MATLSFRSPERDRSSERKQSAAGRLSRRTLPSALALLWAMAGSAWAEPQWMVETITTPRSIKAVERFDGKILVSDGHAWFRFMPGERRLEAADPPRRDPPPAGALPDARVAHGRAMVARAWFADPTTRYSHAVLGDAIEGGSLVIERRDGKRGTVRLGKEAVFEDLEPRIATIGGAERLVVIKSYLDKGSAVAIVDPASFSIIGETSPIGHGFAWNNVAGIADFDGDGSVDIAVVRLPHAVGRLELWSWRAGRLVKVAEMLGFSNHVLNSRALKLSAVADFNGDGYPDLALPAFDRRSVRLISFADEQHEIARIALPSRVVTNFGLMTDHDRPILVMGLEDGRLAIISRQ